MKKPTLIFLTLLAAAFVIGITLQLTSERVDTEDFSLRSACDADMPLAITASNKPDFRIHRFNVWQRLATPTISSMEVPMGSESGALVYNAQPFAAPNEKRGGPHLGDDWNGIGGMNTDLGDPIYAAADGVVSYTGEPSPGWGKIVILQHRLADGTSMQTMYAHLHQIFVSIGTLVGRGHMIGTNGTANGNYPAHLHYEVRIGDGIDIGGGYGHTLNRKNPVEVQSKLAPPSDSPTHSALAIYQQERLNADPMKELQFEGNVERLLEIIQSKKDQ